MKKFMAALLCVAILCTVLTACSTLKGDEKGAVVSMYLSEFPDSLDPALVQLNDETSQLLGLIFESLTTIDANGNVVGALATNWYGKYDERDEEYKMYFELKNTSWSDTTGVQAQHVVDAWARILDPATESPYAAMLYPIKNAKNVKSGVMTRDDLGLAAEDDRLLCVTFEEEFDINLFAEIVSDIHLCPQREDKITSAVKNGEDWAASSATIVCNGPFTVKGMTEGEKLTLERNSYYMRNPDEDAYDKYVLPHRIVCLYQESTLEKVKTVESPLSQIEYQQKRWNDNAIFLIGDFNKTTYAEYAQSLTTKPVLSSCSVYYNCSVISDASVRKALSLAIDRNDIVTNVTGTGETAATGIVPIGVFDTGKGTSFRQSGTDLYSGTAEKKSGTVTLTYLMPESADLYDKYRKKVKYENVYEDIANAVKKSWEAIGFTVELRGLHTADYRKALYERDYEALLINVVGDSTDAYTYLAPYAKFYSGAAVSIDFTADAYSLHYTNYDSADYEAIIDKIVLEDDRAERARLCHEAETILGNDCPAAALFYYSYSYTTKSALSGISSNYFGFVNFSRLALADWRTINAAEDEASAAAESANAAAESPAA